MPIYIIEHLEPKISKWCLIEYEHISLIIGRKNLWFTNIKSGKLKKLGKIIKNSASKLKLKNSCILDPQASRLLSSTEASHFSYFIFGGILGSSPPKKRTKKELTSKFIKAEARNIGKKQMSIDNAAYTVKQIVAGKNFKSLKFKDAIEIPIRKYESIILPYRYNVVNGKPLISSKLISFLKRKKGF
jgi:ribosome biogenesis SPOUT family RNA methylase Rps3